jgi:hypothetical protein
MPSKNVWILVVVVAEVVTIILLGDRPLSATTVARWVTLPVTVNFLVKVVVPTAKVALKTVATMDRAAIPKVSPQANSMVDPQLVVLGRIFGRRSWRQRSATIYGTKTLYGFSSPLGV